MIKEQQLCFSSVQRVQFALYLAMLYPERGTQRKVVCPSAPSVCMSVRPSLTLRYRDHTMILTIYSTHYSIRAKELFTIYANLPMDWLSHQSVLVLCVKTSSSACYTLTFIDICLLIAAYLFLLQTFIMCVFCHCNITAYCHWWK